MRILSSLVVASLLLAGCSDKPKAVSEEDGFREVETGPDTGAISGVVVDATITPVAGANVTIQGGPTTTTADGGTFVFSDLSPGFYFLEVGAAGFLSQQQSVEVKAGVVAKPRVQLLVDPKPSPYHATEHFNGHMVAYGTIASFALHLVLQEAGLSICTCEWTIQLDAKPDEVIIEGQWDDSVPDPQGPQEYYLEVFDIDINDCLFTGDHASGFRVSMTDECSWEEEQYRVALTGPQFWVAVEQSYDLFVTPFYGAPAPSDWAILTGST